ncbi:hypothetical protein [Microcoleus sp.]|uniref:hypothetical protein n=1 Tax=Microcoleus sp. TaxID=44472 RepID=UPI00403EAFFB
MIVKLTVFLAKNALEGLIFFDFSGIHQLIYSGSQESEVCPMPNALCPMPNTQCPMPKNTSYY